MTIDEFLARLKSIDDGWYLAKSAGDCGRNRPIRRVSTFRLEEECPITALLNFREGKYLVYPSYLSYAVLGGTVTLGLSLDDALRIVRASDASFGYDVPLRERLLEACGLGVGATPPNP